MLGDAHADVFEAPDWSSQPSDSDPPLFYSDLLSTLPFPSPAGSLPLITPFLFSFLSLSITVIASIVWPLAHSLDTSSCFVSCLEFKNKLWTRQTQRTSPQ